MARTPDLGQGRRRVVTFACLHLAMAGIILTIAQF
jgi:hypothetical protein